MKFLLLDTCGATGSIALADTDPTPVIVSAATLPGRTASERLIPAVKSLLADQGTSLQSLDAIAIVHGPGSFTGVRIGLSAAKGLCEGLGVPLVAISRLAVLAGLAQVLSDSLASSRTHAVLDAGRGEFYYGEYMNGLCLREALLTRDEVLSILNGASEKHTIVACEPTVAESLAIFAPRLVPEPTAPEALPLALRRIREEQFDDIATIDANYVRRTDAEIFAKPKALLR